MLSSLVSPLRFGILFGIVLLLAWRWMPRVWRALGIAVLVVCVALTTPLAANLLVQFQESRAKPDSACASDPPATIVVLGGGVTREAIDANDYAVLTEASLRRLFAAADLQRARPASVLVISGGVSRYSVSESALLGALAERLGVPESMRRHEERSRTTWQNAQFVAALQPAIASRIELVTSALHMPRARYAFEQAGYTVCPHAVDPRHARADGIGYFLPSTGALQKTDAALHEIIGEAAYRLGWLRDTARNPHVESGER